MRLRRQGFALLRRAPSNPLRPSHRKQLLVRLRWRDFERLDRPHPMLRPSRRKQLLMRPHVGTLPALLPGPHVLQDACCGLAKGRDLLVQGARPVVEAHDDLIEAAVGCVSSLFMR